VFPDCVSPGLIGQRATVLEVEFGCGLAILVGYSGDQICELVERGDFARSNRPFISERPRSSGRMPGFHFPPTRFISSGGKISELGNKYVGVT